MLNWLKATRKKMNARELKPERADMLNKLLGLTEEKKHINQYNYE